MYKIALSFFSFVGGGGEGREQGKDYNSFPSVPLTTFYKQFQTNQIETKQSKEAICTIKWSVSTFNLYKPYYCTM